MNLEAAPAPIIGTDLAERAGLTGTARHVNFEAAHGYTSNVRLDGPLAIPEGVSELEIVEDLGRLMREEGGEAVGVEVRGVGEEAGISSTRIRELVSDGLGDEAAGLLEPQLLLVLQGAHPGDRLEGRMAGVDQLFAG